jgi:hypothetical protein
LNRFDNWHKSAQRLLGSFSHDCLPAGLPLSFLLVFPNRNRSIGLPRNNTVQTKLSAGLNGKFVTIAFGQSLH